MKFLIQNETEPVQVVDGPVDVPPIIDQLTNELSTEEPFYVMDIDVNVRMHQAWLKKMPRVVPHYAIKCNDTEVVSVTLATLGASFDCATEGKILALVVSPDRIIIVNPMKPSLHLRYISANNVKTMTFDIEIELHKIRRFCPDAKLVLRIRCEAEKATCPLRKKFVCEFVEEVPSLIKIASIMNPDVISISLHVRSGCSDFPIYYKAIFIARDLFDYAKQLGYEFNLLDIGGVFPGSHRTLIDEVALIINTVMDKFFADKSVHITTKLLTWEGGTDTTDEI